MKADTALERIGSNRIAAVLMLAVCGAVLAGLWLERRMVSDVFGIVSILVCINLVAASLRLLRTRMGVRRQLGVLLHLNLVVILLLVVWNLAAGFRGHLVVTEGQTVSLEEAGFTSASAGMLYRHRLNGTALTLDEIERSAEQGPAAEQANLRIHHRRRGEAVVEEVATRVNDSGYFRGYDVHLIGRGPAPQLAISYGERALMNAFVTLQEVPGSRGTRHADKVVLFDEGLEVEISTVKPDDGGTSDMVRVTIFTSKDRRELATAEVPLYGAVEDKGFSIQYSSKRQYGMIGFVRDPANQTLWGAITVGVVLLSGLLGNRVFASDAS